MGPDDQVGILMAVNRGFLSSMRNALAAGKPVDHDAVHGVSIETFINKIYRQGFGKDLDPAAVSATVIAARLDAGRWLVDCPLGCGGAELVSNAEPWFVCLSCGSGGEWYRVELPSNRADIEVEITRRDNVLGWSWNPGESIDNLRAETDRIRGE